MSPIYYQKKAYRENEVIVNRWIKQVNPSDQKYQEKYNAFLLNKQVTKKTEKPDFSFNSSKSGVIGFVEFPTVRIPTSAIYKKKTSESLFQYKFGSFPGVGDSGHLLISFRDHWKNQAILLNLSQLKVGDCFYLRIGQQKKSYQVLARKKAHEQVDLRLTSNEQLLTLEMKEPSGFTDKYLVFNCKQLSNEESEKLNTASRVTYSYQFIAGIFLLLNGTFFAGLVLKYQGYIRRAHSKSLRSKHEGYKKLRGLLQVTRGYYIVLGLCMLFFLLLVIQRYLL